MTPYWFRRVVTSNNSVLWCEIHGPEMVAQTVIEDQAPRTVDLMNIAYEAGRASMRADIRETLGIEAPR